MAALGMVIELPDIKGVEGLSVAELRLELACALYQHGKVGKVTGSELAGVSFFEFQRALGERRIETVTEEMLEHDLATLKTLLPK